MNDPTYAYQNYLLRSLSAQTGCLPIKEVASQPGIRDVYRLSILYGTGRAHDSVATLARSLTRPPQLSVRFINADMRNVETTLTAERADAFKQAIATLRLDKLTDQPGIPARGVDIWLVERAAGSFSKSVILAPELSEGVYRDLVRLFSEHLPEALQLVQA